MIEHMDTHNEMLDAVLSVAGRRYHGLYSVSLKTDEARAIIMPAQFKEYAEKEAKFSILFAEYVRDSVKTDHRRQVQVFLQYDRLIQQIQNGTAPSVSYEKPTEREFC